MSLSNLTTSNFNESILAIEPITSNYGESKTSNYSESKFLTNSTDRQVEDDYLDYDSVKNELEIQKALVKNREQSIMSALMGSALSMSMIIIFIVLLSRARSGLFGFRIYALNIALVAIIQVVFIVWSQNDDYYGVKKLVSINTRKFLDKYKVDLMEWTQIVYCSSTFILISNTIRKYRNRTAGSCDTYWIIQIIVVNIVPLIIIFVKGEFMEYIRIYPKPLATYHVLHLGLLILGVGAIILSALFCSPLSNRYRSQRISTPPVSMPNDKAKGNPFTVYPTPPTPFLYNQFICVCVYVILTNWCEFTGLYNIGMDLVDPNKVVNVGINENLAKFVTHHNLVRIGVDINKWSTVLRPFLETFFALLLLPTLGSQIFGRLICRKEPEVSSHGLSGPRVIGVIENENTI